MLETVIVTELVTDHAVELLVAAEVENSVIEAPGSDILLTVGEPTPEIIEVA